MKKAYPMFSKSLAVLLLAPLSFKLPKTISYCFFVFLMALTLKVTADTSLPSTIRKDHIDVSLVTELAQITPNQSFWVGVHFQPDFKWHTYWRNPGDSGTAPRVNWHLPSGWTVSEPYWQVPEAIPIADLMNYGYYSDSVLLFKMQWTPAKALDSIPFDAQSISADISWLVCEEICIPGNAKLGLDIPAQDKAIANPEDAKIIANAITQLPQTTELKGEFFYETVKLSVVINMPGDQQIDSPIYFFPKVLDTLHHFSDQKWSTTTNTTLAALTTHPNLLQNPEQVEGVMRIGDKGFPVVLTNNSSPSFTENFTALSQQTGSHDVPLHFLTALLFAFLGGIILNAMPCVFPILSIKALSISKAQEHGAFKHSLYYTLGVVFTFLVIGGLLIALRELGHRIGWGFQLQEPLFILVLIYVFYMMSLALMGWYVPGAKLMGLGSDLTSKKENTNSSAFLTGLLAVFVATPCVAPLMAPALGYALIVPWFQALCVFLALALGFAMPIIAIARSEWLRNKMPKPGLWMEKFKQFLAFPMLITIVWLLSVLEGLSDSPIIYSTMVGLIGLTFVVWWQPNSASIITKSFRFLIIVLSLAPFYWLSPPGQNSEQNISSVVYSESSLEQLRNENQSVFVNLTADWCITCKINEKVVFSSTAVNQLFSEPDFTYMVGDWTNSDPTITAKLEEFSRSGVPLYLVYHGQNEPLVLPQLLTPKTLLDAMTKKVQ
ncbi:MAG: protein-disulfide reductase DsbD domain-containing protein [Pseudomonadota bacterium]